MMKMRDTFFPRSRFFACITLFLFFARASPAAEINAENRTVYRTASGEKYHEADCSALARSKIAVSLVRALESGYEPCGICQPPFIDIFQGLYRVNQKGLAGSTGADISLMMRAEVTEHVDGDTIRVRVFDPPGGISEIETIRLLGVDTPETVHPNTRVQYFGREASDFTKSSLLGRRVFLAFDWDLRDGYGRLLAYIYTERNRCFNADLIRQGYAYAYLKYPFQFADEFRALEQKAAREKAGLWN